MGGVRRAVSVTTDSSGDLHAAADDGTLWVRKRGMWWPYENLPEGTPDEVTARNRKAIEDERQSMCDYLAEVRGRSVAALNKKNAWALWS